jgi:hypothetical protein
MREKLQDWLWVAALGFCLLYPSFSKADDPNDRCGGASQTGSAKPNDAASSQGIVPPTEAECKKLKDDIEEVMTWLKRGFTAEELLSKLNPPEYVDYYNGPGFHAFLTGLITRAGKTEDLRAWANAEYAKCHGVVKPEGSNS